MPLINLRTSLEFVDRRDELLLELSAMLAEQTGKPEDYVMTPRDQCAHDLRRHLRTFRIR